MTFPETEKKDRWGIRKNTQSGRMNSFIFTMLIHGKKVTGESLLKAMGGADNPFIGIHSPKRVKSHVSWLIANGFLTKDGREA